MKKILGLLFCLLYKSFGEICDRPLVFEFDTAERGARLNHADIDWLNANGITVLAGPSPESGSQPDGSARYVHDSKSVADPNKDNQHLEIPGGGHEHDEHHKRSDKSPNSRSQVVFRFDNPTTVQQVGLVDLDDSSGATITATMLGGGTMSINLNQAGVMSNKMIDIFMDNVEELSILFTSANGAINSLNLCAPATTKVALKRRLRRQASVVSPTSPKPTPRVVLPPTSKPTNPHRRPSTDPDKHTPAPTSPPGSCDPMSFLGVTRGYSFKKGSIHLEWDPATNLVLNQSSVASPCPNVTYHVFFSYEKFDYRNQTLKDLLDNEAIIHVQTKALELTKNNLRPNSVSAILVIASLSGDKVSSDNRDAIAVKVASVSPKLGSNVSFAGLHEPSETVSITFDNKRKRLYFNSSTKLPQSVRNLTKGKHLAFVASDGSHYLVVIKSVVGTISNTNAQFLVETQALSDIFEQLQFDISHDVAKGYQDEAATIFQRPGRRRKLKDFGFDKTVTIDKTATFGPLKVRGKIQFRVYIRATVNIGFFTVQEASLSAGGSEATLASIEYAQALKETKQFNQRLVTGPKITITFAIGPVPVWIDFQPVVDVFGSVSVSLEAAVLIAVTQDASIDAFAGYKNGKFSSYVHSNSKKDLITNVQGKAKLSAEAGVTLTLQIELWSVVGVGIGVSGGLNCAAEVELISNLVLLQPPSILPLQMNKFDVNVFFRVPIKLTSIFGDHDFGNLYALTVPLLALPKFDIKKVSVATCDAADNAIVLTAKVVPQPYNLLIPNGLANQYQWWHDFNPLKSLNEDDDPAAKFYVMEGADTLQVKLRLSREIGTLGSTAAWLRNSPFDIPAGRLYFRTTPKIPGIPYSLVGSVDMTTLFGNKTFECCQPDDCSARYSSKTNCDLATHTCVPAVPVVAPSIAPVAPWHFPPLGTPKPFFDIPSLVSFTAEPSRVEKPVVIKR